MLEHGVIKWVANRKAWFVADLIFVTNITNIFMEKNCHLEKFQLSMHDNCGETENFSTCGEISDVST